MDASSLYRQGRAQNFLEPEHAAEILQWVQKFGDVADRTRVVRLAEIADEDWTLNISRYGLPPIGADIPPLDVAIEDFKTAWERAQEAEERLKTLLTQSGWLEEN